MSQDSIQETKPSGFRPEKCPRCNSSHVWKHNYVVTVKLGKRPRWKCADCGHTFY